MKEYKKRMQSGGQLHGPSHARGGIPIEAEGGEYIIKNDLVQNK